MIKAVIVSKDESAAKLLAEGLNELFDKRVYFETIPLVGDLNGTIKSKEADMLLTIDLAGFDRVTLTDNISYNLLDCKQVHLILQPGLENKCFLNKILSIAMFFGAGGCELSEEMIKRYPNIPWIKCMEGWKQEESVYSKENIKEIARVIDAVLMECRMR